MVNLHRNIDMAQLAGLKKTILTSKTIQQLDGIHLGVGMMEDVFFSVTI